MKKIVLTGAAGRLGSYLREPLSKMAETLVSSDIKDDIGKLYAGESHLGYKPKDNAEQFADDIYANAAPLDPQDIGDYCHGGPFASVELGNSGLATMNIVDDTKKT